MAFIAQREADERIEQLKKDGAIFYSISKADSISTCLYKTFLAYIEYAKSIPNIYSIMGSKVHDTLESIMKGQATKADLLPALKSELEDAQIFGFDFPKDRMGGTSIRDNWIKNMTHFCENFIPPKGNFTTEELFIYHLGDNRYVRGYIDLVQHNKDGSLSIWDWKTSSQFSKETLLEHGRQLVMYALAKEAEGYTVKTTGWIMLKYVEITFEGKLRKNSKNKTTISKVCDRHKIAQTLKPYIQQDLEDAGYDEIDTDLFLFQLMQSNSLDMLPNDIRTKYSIKPYVRRYEITDELKAETLAYITKQADIFESLPRNDSSQWKPQTINKQTEFFCNYLCDYKHICPHLARYRRQKELDNLSDDLF